ncbi:MAG: histidinol dehydrogenase [Bacteroidales bacterium]|nr:histidinol dehydrogenase [Bacteroidales bacterium]
MKTYKYPPQEKWDELCRRPATDTSEFESGVRSIISRVRSEGDNALRDFSFEFDHVTIDNLKVTREELEESEKFIAPELKNAIRTAMENIKKFHEAQLSEGETVETMPGVKCRRKKVPVEKAGLYIPGGSAPLFSTVLMLGIPAKIAGCRQIILCTPPGKDGLINPLILYTAKLTGITDIYRVGGAQAIAAMAYGTESIPRVDKIFGPGNQYVTKAKEIVSSDGTAIDMPAGPSELLVIADSGADPVFVAADLLSQAEHGPDSQVVLVTDSENLIKTTEDNVNKQLEKLPRKNIASRSLANSIAVLLKDLNECIDFSNNYAPEHLIINTEEADELAGKVINAGSVFTGRYTCESAGDYASGTNHTLPTNGYARSHSGVSTDSFFKQITFQEISREGIIRLGPVIELMAEAENLAGHKNAVSVRLKSIKE